MLNLPAMFHLFSAIKSSIRAGGYEGLRARTSVIVALTLIAGFILALPYLELLDSNDIALVGQDFEIDILNVLTMFGICSVLLLRLLAFLPCFRTSVRLLIQTLSVRFFVFCREILVVFVLPDRLSQLSSNPLPLLI